MASGDVILLEGDDYVGRAVNLASRLCDIAAPGSLLAAADDLELPEWVAAAAHEPVCVKGMAAEVAVVTLSPDQAVLRRKSRSRSANALAGGGRRAHPPDADLVQHRLSPAGAGRHRVLYCSGRATMATDHEPPGGPAGAPALADHRRRPRAVPPRPDAGGGGRRRRTAVVGAARARRRSASAPSSPRSA